jgi:plasmid stability protein
LRAILEGEGVPLLDLLLFKCGRRLGVEIKRMDAVSLTS